MYGKGRKLDGCLQAERNSTNFRKQMGTEQIKLQVTVNLQSV